MALFEFKVDVDEIFGIILRHQNLMITINDIFFLHHNNKKGNDIYNTKDLRKGVLYIIKLYP